MAPKRRLRWLAIPLGIVLAVSVAGCTTTQLHGFLPGFVDDGTPATNRTDMVGSLWVNSWIVLLSVGVVTWGLMAWAAIVYRRRRGQTGLPVQLRYNMPIEIFYTVVPLILVLGFFAFTARDQTIIETQDDNPDVSITAFGKQWAWDFQYNGTADDNSDAVYSWGVQAVPDAQGNYDEADLPTLYLPVNETVHIDLVTRDTLHSFWVIDFLYKKDMISGRVNEWSFTPTREGTYQGKCAELCGEYHSAMLFTVKVVSAEEYEAYLDSLRAQGHVGDISDDSRLANLPGTGPAGTDQGDPGDTTQNSDDGN